MPLNKLGSIKKSGFVKKKNKKKNTVGHIFSIVKWSADKGIFIVVGEVNYLLVTKQLNQPGFNHHVPVVMYSLYIVVVWKGVCFVLRASKLLKDTKVAFFSIKKKYIKNPKKSVCYSRLFAVHYFTLNYSTYMSVYPCVTPGQL